MTRELRYEIDNVNPREKKRFIRKMFDSLVPTYDLLNHLLSMGIDTTWRKHIFRYIAGDGSARALDLCCGTGDLSLLLRKNKFDTISLDFSLNMLERGREKGAIADGAVAGDVSRLPFRDGTFRAATIAFGIRNVPDIDIFLDEVRRVLAPGGTLVILELTRPEGFIMKKFYSLYLGVVLPFIGGLVSGKWEAYRYLAGTIATFIHPGELAKLLETHGFVRTARHPQTFNIASIIVSEKEGA